MDRRFLSIGNLPSNGNAEYGYLDVSVRPLEIGDLTQLFTASSQGSIRNYISVLSHCISTSAYNLTDGDLLYALAWVRLHSYPKSTVTVTWDCKEPVIENRKGVAQLDPKWKRKTIPQLKDRGLRYATCDRKNTIPLTNVSIKQFKLPDEMHLPDFMTIPTVSTLVEYDEEYCGDPKLERVAKLARYIKDGDTLYDKVKTLNKLMRRHGVSIADEILYWKPKLFHGIKDVYVLDCHRCDKKTRVEKTPDLLKFFNITSEESVLNMQYNLANAINMPTVEETPAKKLLYWHSCYEKDLQEKEEKRRLENAKRKGR